MRGHLLIVVVVVVVVCQLTNSMADTDTKDQSLLHLLTKRESLFPSFPLPRLPAPRFPPPRLPSPGFPPPIFPPCICVTEPCPCYPPRPRDPILDPIW
ncbi:prophenin and tritrpticin precursor-like [Pomacea canaliculata]|uniref:prophenin and tritrpticin precursor-like n=1 Tax=Pomacea canaliculata TaxID=400727 RepID=UPI000D72DDF7|nr:prophenin and tritrpticin precursor-like [Pomacea canaliculata]